MTDTLTGTLPDTLSDFTRELIQDLKDLRAGRITARDARVRTQLAREILRAVHLQLEGMKHLAGAAKRIDEAKRIGSGKAKS